MENLVNDLSVLLGGVALLSCLAVLLRQPIIIAYILCGIIVGPSGLRLITNLDFIEHISHLGITLLLFLAGLNLHPQKLMRIFNKTALVTFFSSLASFIVVLIFAKSSGFSPIESLIIALSMMFSSTILTVKLLPTTALHHARMGASCIGVLILQDLLAISVLAYAQCLQTPGSALLAFAILTGKLVIFIVVLFLLEANVLRRLMLSVDRFHEVIFILGLAWCFGIASISHRMGLFYETGAFFAGVVLARHPIAVFIAEELKPLRDFFLVLFFFTLGARLDLFTLREIVIPSVLLSLIMILMKPIVFQKAFQWTGEAKDFAREAGIRLGQLSEFSLLIAILAFELNVIGARAEQFIQLVTILTFVLSSYLVIFKYQTPIGTVSRLNKA